jgi:Spy/CpxP family protein refolding chaperone
VMRGWVLAILAVPGVLCAQGPPSARSGPAWWESAWWNSPLVQNLDLSDAQRKEIRSTVREYRGHLLDLREAVQRTDSDLEMLLNASPVDQRKATEAIDRLANARAELTRTLSQMTLRLRGILTDEQWQQLQQRASERRPGLPDGRRGPGGRRGGLPPDSFKQR